MNYEHLAFVHLSIVLPALVLGGVNIAMIKGTPLHRTVGKVYLCLMLVTGLITLFMPAQVGPRFFGHFGYIHIFSLVALYCVPVAWISARNGNIRRHQNNMIGLYVGGLLIAGTLAFMPGRMLHHWLFG